jgi:hypothetical protein
MSGRKPFDEAKATAVAEALAAAIPDEAIPAALDVDTAHANAQNDTLGNVRTRAATVLSSAAIVVTFATSVGLIAADSSGGGVHLSPLPAFALLGLVLAIGVLTLVTQWPVTWAFDSGTDVFGGKPGLLEIQRAAFIRLEVAIARNRRQLDRVLSAYRWSVALLGMQAALVVVAVIVS